MVLLLECAPVRLLLEKSSIFIICGSAAGRVPENLLPPAPLVVCQRLAEVAKRGCLQKFAHFYSDR